MFVEIINMYGAKILGALLLTLAGIFGMAAKNLVAKYLDTDTKRTLAKVVVHSVVQVLTNVNGDEKMNAALGVYDPVSGNVNIDALYNAIVPKMGQEKIPLNIPKLGTIRLGQEELKLLARYIKEA